MFVIPGIVAMIAYVFIRPQEVSEGFRWLTFPMLLAFTALGFVLDRKVGATKTRPSLMLVLGLAFFGWASLTIALTAPDTLSEHLNNFAPPIGVFLAICLGIPTLRGFRAVTKALLAVTMLLAGIAIHQGASPSVCMVDHGYTVIPTVDLDSGAPRQCKARADCVENGGVAGREYVCEHVGVLGTTSFGGRVRYRGVFQDPNELAWALSLSLPFVFVWFDRRGGPGRRAADLAVIVLVLLACIVCNIMTQSRSGQISLIATLGTYFIRRLGWKGVAAGAVLAIPVLLLGGRAGGESSTEERLKCWAEALSMWREHPFLGVGARQFGKYYFLTAHNSVLLVLAEMGPIGLILFTAIIYLAFKIALGVQRDFAGRPEAQGARAAAFATLAGLVGMIASAFFLSLSYHIALWIMLGLAGAIQAIVARHDPTWRPRWRWRDTWFVVGIDVAVISATAIYLRLKGV
jgi:hypothetical protein